MAIRAGSGGLKYALPNQRQAAQNAAAASAGGSASASAYGANRRYAGLKQQLRYNAVNAELDRQHSSLENEQERGLKYEMQARTHRQQTSLQDDRHAQQTSERLGAQSFSTAERLGRQAYGTSERLGGERHATAERVGRQRFARGERHAGQRFTSRENQQDRQFRSGESQLDRQHRTQEGVLDRQNQYQRDVLRGDQAEDLQEYGHELDKELIPLRAEARAQAMAGQFGLNGQSGGGQLAPGAQLGQASTGGATMGSPGSTPVYGSAAEAKAAGLGVGDYYKDRNTGTLEEILR